MAINTISELHPNAKDLTGQNFERLVALYPTEKRCGGSIAWICLCRCGNKILASSEHLLSGRTRSCGCLQKELLTKAATTHGYRYHPLYLVLMSMVQRCENLGNHAYHNYGRRGISVCAEWRNDPKTFVGWGLKNGWKKGLSVDRKNNDGNYCPENCCFATRLEQAAHTRKLKWFRAWHKDMMCQFMSNNQCEFARTHGLNSRLISACLCKTQNHHRGWTFRQTEDFSHEK